MLSLGNRLSSPTNNTLRNVGLVIQGSNDGASCPAGHAEFDNWDTTLGWSVAVLIAPTYLGNHVDPSTLVGSGAQDTTVGINEEIVSLSDPISTNKGFAIYCNEDKIYGLVGNGSSYIYPNVTVPNDIKYNIGTGNYKNPGSHVLIGLTKNLISEEVTLYYKSQVYDLSDSSSSSASDSWGDVGANVSLVVGGADTTASTDVNISRDYKGHILQVGMWKSSLNAADMTKIYNECSMNVGTYRHWWNFRYIDNQTGVTPDAGAINALDLTHQGDAYVGKYSHV